MKYVLVLGCNTANGISFGGIVDYAKIPETDGEIALHDAIGRALSHPDPIYFGEAIAEKEVCDNSLYESLPFEGRIDTFVCLYVD